MKRPRKSSRKSRRLKVIRLWNYPDAHRAIPYLRNVLDGIRGNYLEAVRHRLAVNRLSEKKPDRETLMALDDARKELGSAEDSFKDSHRELRKLDVFLLDPLNGIALVPTQRDEELAWIVFELFDKAGLTGWRWHKDEFDVRRPLADLTLPSTKPTASSDDPATA